MSHPRYKNDKSIFCQTEKIALNELCVINHICHLACAKLSTYQQIKFSEAHILEIDNKELRLMFS